MQKSSFKSQIFLSIGLSIFFAAILTAPAPARTFSEYEKALEDLDAEHYDTAAVKLRDIVSRDPSNADAHAELGRAYMDLGDTERAIAESTRAIELDPKMDRAYANRSYCEFKLGRMKAGFADSEKAIKFYAINPLDWSIWNTYKNRAQAFKMQRRLDLSAAEQEKARIFELLEQAQTERESGQLDTARQDLDAALKNDDQVPDLWLMRGVIDSNQNKQSDAIADFSKAIKLAPDVPMLYYFRGDCYQQLGKHQQAIDDFTRIIKAKPKLVAYRFVCETGRLRNELMRDDTSPISLSDVYVLRAQSYAAMKKLAAAAKDLEEVGKLDPTDDKALAKNAELTMGTGKFEQAIKDYTKSVAANPKDWTRYKERADAYMQAGKNDLALADYSEVIKLTPNDPGAYMLRALALKSLKKYSEAIPDFSKVLQLRSDDDDAYMERAECYRLMHLYKEALADLDKAAALLPANNNFVKEARAKIYAETGNKTQVSTETEPLKFAKEREEKGRYDQPQPKDDYRNLFLIVIIGAALALLGLFVAKKKQK